MKIFLGIQAFFLVISVFTGGFNFKLWSMLDTASMIQSIGITAWVVVHPRSAEYKRTLKKQIPAISSCMKAALALVVLVVTLGRAFAQGTVVLENQNTGLVKQWTSVTDQTPISVPKNGGYVQLFAAAKGFPLPQPLVSLTPFGAFLNFTSLAGFLAANPGWIAYGTVPIASAAGMFSGGTYTLYIPEGAQADYVVIGWTGSYSNLDVALAAFNNGSPQVFLGESNVATTPTGDPLATPPGIPVSLGPTFSGMILAPPGCLGPYFVRFTPQPANQTVVLGATATFYVHAEACPLPSYQWYFNGASIFGGADGLLQITNAQLTNAGAYYAVVVDYFGVAHTSAVATLTVLTKPVITSAPESQTAFVGSEVSFQVSAAGVSPLAYQWLFNGSALSGAGSTDLQLTNLQLSQSGTYTVLVTNTYGAVTSPPAILTVIASPPTILVPPWNRTAVAGRFMDFVVSAEGSLPLSYQWFFNGSAVAGATGTDLHFTNVQVSQSGNYTVVVTNVFGGIRSAPAVLNVIRAANNPVGAVIGWSATNTLPAGLSDVIAISAGGDHDLALKTDGTVVAWGENTFGQSTVPAGLNNVIAVAAGGYHNLALKTDGTVVAWGFNDEGQAAVPIGLSNVIAIAAPGLRSLALKSDGTVVAWGNSLLGEGIVPADLNGVTAIAAGVYHNLALRFDGRVVEWGYTQGSVPEDLSAVIAIAAGGDNSLALKSDGTVVAWGRNYNGQSTVPAGLSGVIGIATGADVWNIANTHSLALKSDGTVVAWGDNSSGQASVPPCLADVIAVSAGAYHSLALVGHSPMVQAYPASQTTEAGANVTLIARTNRFEALSFQWFFNTTNALPGGTNAVLQLTNVQPAQAGAYTVVVPSITGALTSTPAMLAVIPPVERRMVPALSLLGQPGSLMKLENTDAVGSAPAWVTFDTAVLADTSQWYFDVSRPLPPRRFYRAWQTGVPAIIPSINLYMVPTITLFGTVGSSVRVDYINQFGPSDAWVKLDTVTLTNTSQLHFDVSAPGQPPRLYRLVQVP
ncbi:MAG: immunoglobulin domain-containing protein [Verrucomicrobia bacterium]|nr:immunoglobulin domain-containing protein [Verrucomicrobiota bacterium]